MPLTVLRIDLLHLLVMLRYLDSKVALKPVDLAQMLLVGPCRKVLQLRDLLTKLTVFINQVALFKRVRFAVLDNLLSSGPYLTLELASVRFTVAKHHLVVRNILLEVVEDNQL